MTDHRDQALNALDAVQVHNDNLPELHHRLHMVKNRRPDAVDDTNRLIGHAVGQIKTGVAIASVHALLAIEDRLADLADLVERARGLSDEQVAEMLDGHRPVPPQGRF